MPQANSIRSETPATNWAFISETPRGQGSPRARTYSLPTRPSYAKPPSRHEYDDSDPLARMRHNLERTTFLLSELKVGLTAKPEPIHILPPLDEDSSSSDSDHYPRKQHYVLPQPLERINSTSTTNGSVGTQFTLDVSNYEYGGPTHDHGSEFHQLVNHGKLHNPSLKPKVGKRAVLPPPVAVSARVRERYPGKAMHPPPPPPRHHHKHHDSNVHSTARRERVPSLPTPPPAPVTIRSRPMPPSMARAISRSLSLSQSPTPPPPSSKKPIQAPLMRRVRFIT